MSNITLTLQHPALSTLIGLLNSTLKAGYQLRQDIGLYILDQKYFIKLLRERARRLTRDFALLKSSEDTDDHRAVQMRILPALKAVEREAEVRLGVLSELFMNARAFEESEDEEREMERAWFGFHLGQGGLQGLQLDENFGLMMDIVARPPLVITGSEDIHITIPNALREYRTNNGQLDRGDFGRDEFGLGLPDERGEILAQTPLVVPEPEDFPTVTHNATKQHQTDDETDPTDLAESSPLIRFRTSDDRIADEINIAITHATQQYRINRGAEMGENEDEEYDAANEINDEGLATESTATNESEAHPFSRNNLAPTHIPARIPNLPRFDGSAVPGAAGFVRRQKAWINSQVANEEA